MQAQNDAERWKENESSSDGDATATATTPVDNSQQSEPSSGQASSTPSHVPTVPTVSVVEDHSGTPGSNSRRSNQKTTDISGQNASFASLQRALNAAVAARNQFCQDQEENPPVQTQGPMTSPGYPPSVILSSEREQPPTSTYSEWGDSTESSLVWTPHTPDATFDMCALNSQSQPSDGTHQVQPHPEEYHHQIHPNNEGYPNVQYAQHQSDGWSNQWHTPPGSAMPDSGVNREMYNNMGISSLHPSVDQLSRRGSCSDELADSMGNIGINSVGQSPQHAAQLDSPMENTNLKPHPERELDLAARRKRPRPAAIGTAGLNRSLVGPSSMSPTTRISPFGAGHAVRHAKSTQNMSSRYPGIRKVSSAQRSPLGLSNFTEAGVFHAASNAEMASIMCPPSAAPTTLAPPTPLTPEDLQHLLPTTPSESKFGLAPNPQIAGNYIFPAQQSMQLDIASPPSTPLTFDLLNQLQYQSMAPPMSAPSHYTTFQDFSPPCSSGPINPGSWSDAPPQPSPEDNSFQQSTVIHMPRPTHISPITYEQPFDQCNQPGEDWPLSPQPCPLDSSSTSPPSEPTPEKNENTTEFLIQEFPQQQEAHRHAAKQLPQNRHKTYTFANQTPNDF